MRTRATLLVPVLLLLAGTVQAAGYAVWEMGVRSSAMGGVTTASVDDATAVFFNPAGLLGVENQSFTLDFTVITPFSEFSGVAPDPGYGVTERLADPLFLLPQAYYARRMNDELALGLGFCTPYGLSVEWENPDTYSGRRVATFTDLKTFFLTPSAAYALNDRVRLGAGLNFVWSSVELNRHVVRNLPNPTDLGTVEITGDGDLAVGFNAGALVDLNEKVTVGFSYKSPIDLAISGDADFTEIVAGAPIPADGPAETDVPLPAIYAFGVAFRPMEGLLLEFDYNRFVWSTFEELVLTFPEAPDADETIEEQYSDTNVFRFGAEYQKSEALALRAGLSFDETPQPTAATGPVLPDGNRTGISIGAGYDLGSVEISIYNLFLFFEDREVRDSFSGYNGDYRNYTNLFGLGLSYDF